MQQKCRIKHFFYASVVPDLLVLRAPFAWIFDHPVEQSLHKKWSFPLRISSVNVTKHLLKKSLMENFIFYAVNGHKLNTEQIMEKAHS